MICSKGLPAPLISIHAPRTGSDACPPSAAAPTVYFNPRSPHGERLGGKSGLISAGTISIHAPRTGSDGRPRKNPPTQRTISIHAPCMGSDSTATAWRFSIASFQSTLPARGATAQSIHRSSEPLISIHAPRTGSDNLQLILQTSRWDFNPRSPHGERHDCYSTGLIAPDFNPRSPHGERRPCTALRRTAAN